VNLFSSSQNDVAVTDSSKVEWAISPADRAKYLQMFGAIDKSKKGYLTGKFYKIICHSASLVQFGVQIYIMVTICIC